MLAPARLNDTDRALLTSRLKSIAGQARGVQRMLEEQRDCQEIMDQLAALRAATHAATMQALECFSLECLRESNDPPDVVMARLLAVVTKLTR
jgi:CsoR family transcriptional regulator, copper-sensing transcriptional repressor